MLRQHETMLNDLLDYNGGNLSGREEDFLESLSKLGKHMKLSEKQAIWLGNIWDKVFNPAFAG